MDNSKVIATINQLLHNRGIKQEERLNTLISLFEKRKNGIVDAAFTDILELIDGFDYSDKDLVQELFMLFGSKLTKYRLDQFYTPITISQFINGFMEPNKTAIDPAGGTGDLLLFYNGQKKLWDIDPAVLQLCRFNYELNKQTNYEVACKNSLAEFEESAGTYDYVTMNPPFGSSTTITDKTILSKFELGNGKKKQEIGILFVELGLRLLKPDGILFVIIPAGYAGNINKQFIEMRQLILRNRVIASIELPKNTFKRSGTGVNTYLWIIQKKNTVTDSYPIFIDSIERIGYNLTKSNTPRLYKIIKETGEQVVKNGKLVVDNDLEECLLKLKKFHEDEVTDENAYEYVMSNMLTTSILDVKRYSKSYTTLVNRMKIEGAVKINTLVKIITATTKIEPTKKYKYIDIGEISSPMYSYKDLYGWELPSRAKYTLKKYDILISKLEGTLSYCVILDDADNYISTNGVAVLRPNNKNALYTLFASVIKKDFAIQHKAYLTGSIMASLGDKDLGEFWIETKVDVTKTKKILDTLEDLTALRVNE